MAKRLSQAEALELINQKISSSGGVMTHKQLLDALEADGNQAAVLHVPFLSREKRITASVEAVEGGKPVLSYRLAGGNS